MQYRKRTKREKLIAILLTIAMIPTLVPSVSFAGDFSDAEPAAKAEQQVEKKSEPKAEKKEASKAESKKEEPKAESMKAAEEESKDEQKEEKKDEPKEEVKSDNSSDSGSDSDKKEESEKKDDSDQEQATEPEKDAEETTEATESTEATEAKDEATKEDEEKKDDEDKFPAQDFEKTFDGVTVKIHAPKGALLKDSSLNIGTVSDETAKAGVTSVYGEGAQAVKAMDLTFTNDGENVQPEGDVYVTFAYTGFADLKAPAIVHIDKNGNPTTNIAEIFQGGLLPFGGVKGSGLAGVAQFFSGVASGAAKTVYDLYQPDVNNYGMIVQVVDIEKFMPMDEFNERIESQIAQLLALEPVDPSRPVVYPGYLEEQKLRKALAEGVDVADAIADEIIEEAKKVDMDVSGYFNA